MFKNDDLPAGLPDEVKHLLGRLKPEPQALQTQRKALLFKLEAQRATAQGTVRELLHASHAVLQSLQFHARVQADSQKTFARALTRYAKDATAPKPPPPVVLECMRHLQERVEAMGLGEVLTKVRATPPPSAH